MAVETIALSDLERATLQTRVRLSEEIVAEYAEAMAGGAKFPPVTVFADAETDTLWLADGFHRVAAAERRGRKSVKADVRAGTFADALRHALGANANHGLRRSNADKQRAVEMAWENRRGLWPREDGADPSASVLAEVCGVSLGTVSRFLAEVQPLSTREVERPAAKAAPGSGRRAEPPARRAAPPVRRVFGRDGKTREMPVPARPAATSAPSRPAPAPEPPARTHAAGVVLDRFGVEVPMEIKGAFAEATARDEIEAALRRAATRLKEAMERQDPSVAQFRQADLVELQNAVRTAKFTKAHCVCRICQGNGAGSCTACHGTGFQTLAQYENNPREFRAD